MENVKLDLIPGRVMPICHASQYDAGRVIRFNLFEGDVPYVLDGTETVTFDERKIDGNVVTAACTVTASKSYVDVETTEQMCACYGQNLCELKIEKGDAVIGTLNFVLDVERDPLEGGIQSESEIYNLQVQVTAMANAAVAEAMSDYDIYGAYVTEDVSGAIASFTDGADDVPVKALSVEFAASQASGTPTPSAPIPITPVNSIAVTRTGKNLLGGSKLLANAQAYLPSGTTDIQNKTFTFNANATATSGLSFTSGVKFKENTAYTFILACSKSNTNVGTNIRFSYTDGTSSNLSLDGTITADTKYTKAFTSNASKTLEKIIKTSQSGTTTLYYDECGVFEGDISETDYEAYNGTTALINLGGTYYGGSVDAVTGKITLTHQLISYTGAADENWSIINQGDANQRFRLNPTYSGMSLVTCSHCQLTNTNTANWGYCRFANNYFVLTDGDNQIGSVENLKIWLATQYANGTPLSILVELATPIVVYASNTISLNTLLGDNNFFSDAGDVDVTYRADTALYIDKRLNA